MSPGVSCLPAKHALSQRGWTVIRIWEHTKPRDGADTIEHALTADDGVV